MNSKRGQVTFEAGGDTYALRMGTNAMARYEDASGETIDEALKSLEKGRADISRIRSLFWAGLSSDRGLSLDDVGDLIDEIGLNAAVEKLGEAITAAFPDAEVSTGNAGKPSKSKAA